MTDRPFIGGRLWNFASGLILKSHVFKSTASQLTAILGLIVGVVWTSGNHQVDSHSSRASYCARFSLFRALVGSTSGMGLIVSWTTPPLRGGHGGSFGGHGYLSSSSCTNERAAKAYGVAVGTPLEAAGALVAVGCGALVAAACGAAGSVDEPHETTSASKNIAISGSNRPMDILIRPDITLPL